MQEEVIKYCKNELLKLQKSYNDVLNRPMSGTKKSVDTVDMARNETQIHSSAFFRNQMGQKLDQVNAALNAIEDGTYGICKITGAPISEKRLRAMPWALTSIESID